MFYGIIHDSQLFRAHLIHNFVRMSHKTEKIVETSLSSRINSAHANNKLNFSKIYEI